MKIKSITPCENAVLQIIFDDGKIVFFDVKPYLKSEAFLPLNDENEFKKIHNGGYFIEWQCGADLSSDTIAYHLQKQGVKSACLP